MDSKPSVAFINKAFPFGGAEQVTIDVANYLCRHGFRVSILTINHREEAYPKGTERLFEVHTLPKGAIKWSGKVARAVRDFILDNKVSVLITYRELLYAHWLKKQTGVRMVFELHTMPGYEFIDIAEKRTESKWKNLFYGCGVEALLKWFYRSKYRRVYGWCDAYGVLSESYRKELIDRMSLSDEGHKVCVLPNSISLAKNVNEDKQKVVLYVGRLTRRDKRIDRLLRIWKQVQNRLPDWQLKIVGTGPAENKLKALAELLALERCSFEGYTTSVSDYYDEASILCLTSSFEGWPMCVAEAQAHGVVPIVFGSFSAAREQISSDDEGICVPPFDESLYASQLIALASDPSRLSRMQKAVVTKASTYNIERSGEAWIKMFNTLLPNRTTI